MANPGPGLLLLVTEEVTVSLLAPEEVTISLLAPEVAMDSLLAESPPEAAAVGPRGDQAVVGGGGLLLGPLCPVGFDLNLSISSDELFKQPCCLASAVEPLGFTDTAWILSFGRPNFQTFKLTMSIPLKS